MSNSKSVPLLCIAPILMCFPMMSFISVNGLKLRQLNVVFRHGDRTPETFPKLFPNDPNMNDTFYPFGSGSLTTVGKQRAYRLGEFLRKKYNEFLGTEYDERRLYGISSSLSRTKMSLQLVLAGLYPPSLSGHKWHENLDWQPIPTYYYAFQQDKLFVWDKCDIYMEEINKVYNSSKVKNLLRPYKNFTENLRLTVGKKTPLTFFDIILLHTNLNIEKKLNLTMKPWMTDLLANENLKELKLLYYKIRSYNDLLKRLNAGLFIRRIVEDMLRASNKTLNFPQKISLYSGHDHNIIDIIQSLKIYKLHFPEYTSALIFKLLSKNGEFYVKILYYLGIPEKAKTLMIPGCPELCPLNTFINLTKSAQILDKELESKISSEFYYEDII